MGRKSAFLDVDWLRIDTLETLIVRARCMRCASLKVSHSELMVKYEIMILACQVGPFHLKLTQITSEMNFTAKHKCSMSQKVDTRRRGEKLSVASLCRRLLQT